MNEIIINYNTTEKRFATIENNSVVKLYIQQPQDQSHVGNIYIGKIIEVKNGMNAAFVDIGTGKNGYLHRDQIPAYIHSKAPTKHIQNVSKYAHVGEKIMVQIKKDETDIKGPLLTGVIEVPGEKMIYLPEGQYIAVSKKGDDATREKWRKLANQYKKDHEGFIIRTEAFSSNESDILSELEYLRKSYKQLLQKIETVKAPSLVSETSLFENEILKEMKRLKAGTLISDNRDILSTLKQKIESDQWKDKIHFSSENIFSTYNVESEIEKGLKRIIWLNNGSYIVIDETEALISIDVNTGKFTGNKNLQDTVLQTNLLAAKEIAKQLLLRDYGGMILIDFIDMKNPQHQKLVQKAFQDEIKKDSKHTRVLGFTSLGILQVTRKKTKKSLSETMLTQCPVCTGTGKIESSETIAFRLERELFEKPFAEHEAVLIELTEDVKTTLCGEINIHLHRLEKSLHVKLFFKIVHGCRPQYILRQFGSIKQLSDKYKD